MGRRSITTTLFMLLLVLIVSVKPMVLENSQSCDSDFVYVEAFGK